MASIKTASSLRLCRVSREINIRIPINCSWLFFDKVEFADPRSILLPSAGRGEMGHGVVPVVFVSVARASVRSATVAVLCNGQFGGGGPIELFRLAWRFLRYM